MYLRKWKQRSLMECLVWIYLWRRQICCFYKNFWDSFKSVALVLPAAGRLLPSFCGLCSPSGFWCHRYGSMRSTWGQIALLMCLMWFPVGFKRKGSCFGNDEDRWKLEQLIYGVLPKSHSVGSFCKLPWSLLRKIEIESLSNSLYIRL